ncbi:DUF29 domain-containing protein [Gloeocapsopsis dulcis]|uniref:DUF29 domain-containing protein n=1 Tax=Gloeocapsopsis dulcis AAB1 = 1H9 TaxID=1433147 RepID=A0A6N8FST3_9CHRO|nr:DUF29 domain-containing protein [Gloeocapsopsis dulcis]MUL35006.1 hypothetical protein [Gloeocapsopsis dulcis AAB1 = 1H9]WNN89919.1 DUF29 domain-containing protein [Gloeocapsopsis dulcis]
MTAPLETQVGATQYEVDFVSWVEQQAALLKEGRLSELDVTNLMEEVEELGRSEKRALRSQLIRVIKHLLKLNYQPNAFYYLNSWRSSIAEGRTQLKLILQDSPSLKPYLAQVLADCYQDAVTEAVTETGLIKRTFPQECPYSQEEVLDPMFLPVDGTFNELTVEDR